MDVRAVRLGMVLYTNSHNKKVRSDNDESELVILGHFGRLFGEFGASGEVEGVLEMYLNISTHFRRFS